MGLNRENMISSEEQEIIDTINQITQNYKNSDILCLSKNKQLPTRKEMISIIKELRGVVFPGYFEEYGLSVSYAEYYSGNRIINIRERLNRQLILALGYSYCEEDYNVEEITKRANEISLKFVKSLPDIQQMLLLDVDASFNGDPAAKTREEIISCYPGFFAIYVYRLAHELYLMQVPFIPRIMTEYAHSRTGIDINPGATIGKYFFIDHGTGVVIGETTEIGDNVKLYQGVTLGALSTRSGQKLRDVKRHPTIKDNVTIYSGATVLGGETVIGEGTVIGGNAFITESIPANAKVIVKNPEFKIKETRKQSLDADAITWDI